MFRCRMPLIDEILSFDMEHNAEAEACDLLLEVSAIPFIYNIMLNDLDVG